MSKVTRVHCVSCSTDKGTRNFYASNSPMHKNGYIPFCKVCLKEQLGGHSVGEVKEVLRRMDRPFLQDVWEDAQREDEYNFGVYMRHLGLAHNRELTWEDSRFEGMQVDVSTDTVNPMRKLTINEINELEDDWGYGHEPEMLQYFERKYRRLVENYPVNTSLHEEALRTYCVYKVQAEVSTSRGDVDDAKKWGEMAQKQGEIAKINLNKLTKSDLSQGLDGFGQLARMVEEAVDIVPVMPRFVAKPHDKVDFAILCYINYMRKLEGRPEATHSEVYEFYERGIEEQIEMNPELKEYLTEVEIDDGKGGKKKVLTIDMTPKVRRLKLEHPNDPFYQNLDKWIEVLSYLRWFPDIFFDMIRPEKGGMRLDADQRMLIRGLARFRTNMGVFSRGYGKCVAGDTLIPTNEGYVEIGSLFDYQDNNVETDYDMNVTVLNREDKVTDSDAGVYSGKKPTKIITTKKGYTIETTFVHPLLIEDDGEIWKEAKDIDIGDRLILQENDKLYGDNDIEFSYDMGSQDCQDGVSEVSSEILTSSKATIVGYVTGAFKGSGNGSSILGADKYTKQMQILLLGLGRASCREKYEDKYILTIEDKIDGRFTDEVASIEDSQNHVYDLQVPETNSFNSNGFISHNTMVQLMYNYHASTLYPNCNMVMTAQTKENASSLIGEKHNEMKRFFPLLIDELDGAPRIQKDKAEIKFKSNSRLDTLSNTQSSKGARRHRLTIEESAQVSEFTFQDVLEPVVNIPRKTIGSMAVVNPFELNGQINSFTTSWYRNSSEYEKSVKLKNDMLDLNGTLSLGAGWELPCEFGRGEPKSQVLDKKDKLSPTFFATNYQSHWVGVTDGALVNIADMMALRTQSKAELKGVKNGEYYIGVDVARSQSSANNQCSVAIVRVTRNADNRINMLRLVNIINIPSMYNFKVQAQEVMKIKNLYDAKVVCVDGNGLGENEICAEYKSSKPTNVGCVA